MATILKAECDDVSILDRPKRVREIRVGSIF